MKNCQANIVQLLIHYYFCMCVACSSHTAVGFMQQNMLVWTSPTPCPSKWIFYSMAFVSSCTIFQKCIMLSAVLKNIYSLGILLPCLKLFQNLDHFLWQVVYFKNYFFQVFQFFLLAFPSKEKGLFFFSSKRGSFPNKHTYYMLLVIQIFLLSCGYCSLPVALGTMHFSLGGVPSLMQQKMSRTFTMTAVKSNRRQCST